MVWFWFCDTQLKTALTPITVVLLSATALNLNRLLPVIDEPRISLPETFGACMKTPLKMSVQMPETNFRYPSPWNVHWYHVWTRNGKRHRTTKTWNFPTLTVANPLPEHTGGLFEVDVRNPFGLARGATRIIVTEGKILFFF